MIFIEERKGAGLLRGYALELRGQPLKK